VPGTFSPASESYARDTTWAYAAFSGQYPNYGFGIAASADPVDLTALRLTFFNSKEIIPMTAKS
jgi:hypothetical protein